jgi:hypothetical protein
MSSAILYLAIIAIWAGFLVPAWVRRPHAHPAASTEQARESGRPADDELTVEYVTETENDVEVTLGADVHVEVSHHEREHRTYEYSEHEYSEEPRGELGQDGGAAGQFETGYGGYEDYAAAAVAEFDARDGRLHEPRPTQSREQMLHARRRMLTILVGMTLITGGFTGLGVVSWWICVPPAGMLVLYALLLREIALADAELARKRDAWEAAQARAYHRHMRAQTEREAHEAAQPNQGAQIIDISGRVTDQLYDQYADAAVRAVGD